MAWLIARHFLNGLYARSMFDNEADQRDFLTKMLHRSCREALEILNIKVILNAPLPDPEKPYMVVSNHVSYVDVMVMGSLRPMAFVTSKEIEETFFLGDVCKMGGCYFVERRNALTIRHQLSVLTRGLKSGISIGVFPEATSTDGSEIRPFKRGLLAAAEQTGVSVLPICLNYTRINGQPIDRRSRDSVFYYGSMSFFPHLKRLLLARSIEVELKVLEEVQWTQTPEVRSLSDVLYEKLSAAYVPVT